MLYVGCSACGSTGPLWCAGQFMPHAPVPADASAMGPFCNYCGMLPSLFTCMACGTSQWIYMPGMAPPPQAMGQQRIAPAVFGDPGAPPHRSAFAEVLVAFAKAAGGSFGDQMGQQWTANANANPWGSY